MKSEKYDIGNRFPKEFVWGCATASYQVEGALDEGGRADCIWDTFSKIPGAVYAGENGNIAIDQYHRYKEDIRLMHELGFQSYRFSIAWPRIVPEKGGEVNMGAIEHYRDICRTLHEYGMTAMVTLYHWDLPQYLEDEGGWLNRKTAEAFRQYAEYCFTYLGDLVDGWITLNEPYCSAYLGYWIGVHAPGKRDVKNLGPAVHHLNLAHGLAMTAYRKSGLKAPIGITWNAALPQPVNFESENVKAAQDGWDHCSAVFSDPVFFGRYPQSCIDKGYQFPVESGDMEHICQPVDFIGVNYYTEQMVEACEEFPGFRPVYRPGKKSAMGWDIREVGLFRLLEKLNRESGGVDLYITENGMACDDILTESGRVHDSDRMEYIRSHLEVCRDAVEAGIPLKGYYVWSFSDNYEWSFGYTKRFGIVYCDYADLKRYPKDSAYMMRDIIRGFEPV